MTLEEGRKALFELRFNFSTLPREEQEKHFDEYQKELKRIKHEIAKTLIEERNNEKGKVK